MTTSLHSSRYETFRKLLIDARKKAKISQVQLAVLMNKPQSFISKYEIGERRLDFTEFMEIAGLLNIDIKEFVLNYQSKINDD